MRPVDPVIAIKGVGKAAEDKFHKLEIYTVRDLLEHYPFRYDKYENIKPIAELQEGMTAAVEGNLIRTPEMKKVRNLKLVTCRISDGTSNLQLTWFNMPFLMKQLKLGTSYIVRGKIVRKSGMLVMDQPTILSKQEFYNKVGKLLPVYGLTSGLSNHQVAKAVSIALKEMEFHKDFMPKPIRDKYELMDYKKAVKTIHEPKNEKEMMEARNRLVFDEFFLFSLAVQYMKENRTIRKNENSILPREECDILIKSLPYALTSAQKKVWEEIKKDMMGPTAMQRLVQGDVGSGKTIVAVLALVAAAKNGYQGCMMAPTEVLAKQHYESMVKMLKPYNIKVTLLVGSMTAKEKRDAYEQIKNHDTDLIIGTHALIQEKVEYASLGLVITDEQHRFGVRQREVLAGKGTYPHVLVMSATPIPRTLAIILYGDLDISIIDELPANRLPIKNCVVDTTFREKAYRFIEKEVMAGRQAYVICPMVEESEVIEAENVIEYTIKLKEALPSSVQVDYLHGKMKPSEKNEIMERFSKGEIQVLVSTTVVEVGVNVPNATVMMVENAERFGLAQLHQLRGRVGRGDCQSYCIFVCGSGGKDTMERLEILNHSNDGFYIAEEDLKLRGPGDMFGIRQSGLLEFKLADVYNDAKILKQAAKAAKEFMEKDTMVIQNNFLREKMMAYAGQTSL